MGPVVNLWGTRNYSDLLSPFALDIPICVGKSCILGNPQ